MRALLLVSVLILATTSLTFATEVYFKKLESYSESVVDAKTLKLEVFGSGSIDGIPRSQDDKMGASINSEKAGPSYGACVLEAVKALKNHKSLKIHAAKLANDLRNPARNILILGTITDCEVDP